MANVNVTAPTVRATDRFPSRPLLIAGGVVDCNVAGTTAQWAGSAGIAVTNLTTNTVRLTLSGDALTAWQQARAISPAHAYVTHVAWRGGDNFVTTGALNGTAIDLRGWDSDGLDGFRNQVGCDFAVNIFITAGAIYDEQIGR